MASVLRAAATEHVGRGDRAARLWRKARGLEATPAASTPQPGGHHAPPPERVERVRALRAKGMTRPQIAAALRLSVQTIARAVAAARAAGMTVPGRRDKSAHAA